MRLGTNAADLRQEIADAAFDAVDLFGCQVMGMGAEAAWFLAYMHVDLLEALVEDPHQMLVPAGPDLAPQVLRRR